MSETDSRGGFNTKIGMNLTKKKQKLKGKTVKRPFKDTFLTAIKTSKKIKPKRKSKGE
jgi:hypothetical protein